MQVTPMETLQPELLLLVFSQVHLKELVLNVARVCKRWRALVDLHAKGLCLHRMGELDPHRTLQPQQLESLGSDQFMRLLRSLCSPVCCRCHRRRGTAAVDLARCGRICGVCCEYFMSSVTHSESEASVSTELDAPTPYSQLLLSKSGLIAFSNDSSFTELPHIIVDSHSERILTEPSVNAVLPKLPLVTDSLCQAITFAKAGWTIKVLRNSFLSNEHPLLITKPLQILAETEAEYNFRIGPDTSEIIAKPLVRSILTSNFICLAPLVIKNLALEAGIRDLDLFADAFPGLVIWDLFTAEKCDFEAFQGPNISVNGTDASLVLQKNVFYTSNSVNISLSGSVKKSMQTGEIKDNDFYCRVDFEPIGTSHDDDLDIDGTDDHLDRIQDEIAAKNEISRWEATTSSDDGTSSGILSSQNITRQS